MDIVEEEVYIKKCYKCEQPLLDNLNIVYNSATTTIILWNKYQIFVYEDTDFESPEKVLIPEFQIHHVIAFNNYLLCLDSSGNIHITSLKFKACTHKRLKTDFQPLEKGIKTCIQYKEDHSLSVKYDCDAYFLCLHKIEDFQLEKKTLILFRDDQHWPLRQSSKEKYLLASHTVKEDHYELLKKLFQEEVGTRNIYDLILLSVDKLAVYGCLFSLKKVTDETPFVKLYDCPTEICNIQIMDSRDLYLLIGLVVGTVLRISFNDLSKPPDVVHLNTALYKMVALKNFLIYSDGITLWKSEDTFSKEFKLTQFFVRNIKDFVKCGDYIVCTTYTKLVYKFSMEDKNAYLVPKTTEQYCSAEKLLNNLAYLNKLFEMIDLNNEISQKLSTEKDYITAISLTNRQDLVSQAIDTSVLVLENYNETGNLEFVLTEELNKYFEEDNYLLLVRIVNTNIFNTLNEILSHFTDSIRIHITISSPHGILKTTSLKLEEQLKTISFLIPINLKADVTEINLNVKIILNIPGPLHQKQHTCTVLYKKDIVLTSEHFIKTNNKTTTTSLKKPKESLNNLIHKMVSIQHGNIFKFVDVSKLEEATEWSFYVKLPNDFEDLFKTDLGCKQYLSSAKTTFLSQQWNTEKFLKSKTDIVLSIAKERLKIKIENDGFSNPLLKITGGNAKMAFHLRNFFSKLIYSNYGSHGPGKEFIHSHFYTTAENLQKMVKSCITQSATLEEFLTVYNKFEKDIIGTLPL